MSVVTVLTVERRALVQRGLRSLLEPRAPHVILVAAVACVDDAVRALAAGGADVTLLGTSPATNAGEALRTLRAACAGTRIVALADREDAGDARRVLEAGGSGYLGLDAPEAELLDAIDAAGRGEYFLPMRLLASLARLEGMAADTDAARLTPRERESVRRVARGETYREIAAALRISAKSVATYRERAAGKLGLHTRAELVRWALEHHLLD